MTELKLTGQELANLEMYKIFCNKDKSFSDKYKDEILEIVESNNELEQLSQFENKDNVEENQKKYNEMKEKMSILGKRIINDNMFTELIKNSK